MRRCGWVFARLKALWEGTKLVVAGGAVAVELMEVRVDVGGAPLHGLRVVLDRLRESAGAAAGSLC